MEVDLPVRPKPGEEGTGHEAGVDIADSLEGLFPLLSHSAGEEDPLSKLEGNYSEALIQKGIGKQKHAD